MSNAAFVVANSAALTAGDTVVQTRLDTLVDIVTVFDDGVAEGAIDPALFDLLVLSNGTGTTVGSKWKDWPKALLMLGLAAVDDHALASTTGTTSTATTFSFPDPLPEWVSLPPGTYALTADAGSTTVVYFTAGQLPAAAWPVTQDAANPGRYLSYTLAIGESRWDSTPAPGPRAVLSADALLLTDPASAEWLTFFDEMVTWAITSFPTGLTATTDLDSVGNPINVLKVSGSPLGDVSPGLSTAVLLEDEVAATWDTAVGVKATVKPLNEGYFNFWMRVEFQDPDTDEVLATSRHIFKIPGESWSPMFHAFDLLVRGRVKVVVQFILYSRASEFDPNAAEPLPDPAEFFITDILVDDISDDLPYFDGDTPSVDDEFGWEGAPHASISLAWPHRNRRVENIPIVADHWLPSGADWRVFFGDGRVVYSEPNPVVHKRSDFLEDVGRPGDFQWVTGEGTAGVLYGPKNFDGYTIGLDQDPTVYIPLNFATSGHWSDGPATTPVTDIIFTVYPVDFAAPNISILEEGAVILAAHEGEYQVYSREFRDPGTPENPADWNRISGYIPVPVGLPYWRVL